jgi:hypothetical protein
MILPQDIRLAPSKALPRSIAVPDFQLHDIAVNVKTL